MRSLLSAIAAIWFGLLGPAHAEDAAAWPQRQVTIVVPFAPGGTTDLFARIVGEKLQAKYGQPFIVENRPGAGGNIGTANVARAKGDGYTLLVGTVSSMAINPSLYKKLAFDADKDFEPVSGIATLPNLLVVNNDLPVKTVPEVIDYLKANPGKLNFASSGVGTSQHLTAELFALKTGTKMTHIPYKGSAEIMNSLIGGNVQLAFDNMTIAWPQAQGGTVRAIAVTSLERDPNAASVPAVSETIPGFDATSWNGLWAPKGTPKDIVDKLAADVKTIMEDPTIVKKSLEMASTPSPSSPAEFSAFIAKERDKWREVVVATGAQVGQ